MSDAASMIKLTSRAESGELIAQVRQRPCLWDRACAQYRVRADKDAAWRDVCTALEPGFTDLPHSDQHEIVVSVIRRWYNIRDAFKKTRDRGISSRQYCYADQLTFLDPVLGPPAASSGADRHKRKPTIKYEYVAVDEEQDQDGEEWLNDYVDFEQTEASPAKRVKTEPLTPLKEEEGSVLSVLVNLLEREDDEDRAFFKSITPAVKKLPEEAKFVFRIQVMKLLNSLKRRRKDASKSDAATAAAAAVLTDSD